MGQGAVPAAAPLRARPTTRPEPVLSGPTLLGPVLFGPVLFVPAMTLFRPSLWQPIRCRTDCRTNTRQRAVRPAPRRYFPDRRHTDPPAAPAASRPEADRVRPQQYLGCPGRGTVKRTSAAGWNAAVRNPDGPNPVALNPAALNPAGGFVRGGGSVQRQPRDRRQPPRSHGHAAGEPLVLTMPDCRTVPRCQTVPDGRKKPGQPERRAQPRGLWKRQARTAQLPQVMTQPMPTAQPGQVPNGRRVAGTEPGPERKPAPGLTGYLLLGPTHPPNCHAPH